MMKKILLILALMCSSIAWGNPYLLDFESLQSMGVEEAVFAKLFTVLPYVSLPGQIELASEKEEVVGQFLEVKASFEPVLEKNRELLEVELWRLLLDRYSENIGLGEFSAYIEEDGLALLEEYPKDYRVYWLLALNAGQSGEYLKSAGYYQDLMRKDPLEEWSAPLLLDFSEIALMTGMPNLSKHALERAAQKWKTSPKEFGLYNHLEASLKIPTPKGSFKSDDIYGLQERDVRGVYARLFDMFIPMKNSWKYETRSFSNRESMFLVMPDKLMAEDGKVVSYTIMTKFVVPERMTFEDFIEEHTKEYPEVEETVLVNLPPGVVAYNVEDPDNYKTLGGETGIYLFWETSPGLEWYYGEKPAREVSMNSVFDPRYKAFEEKVYYAVLLDTTGWAFEESRKEFSWFIDHLDWPMSKVESSRQIAASLE